MPRSRSARPVHGFVFCASALFLSTASSTAQPCLATPTDSYTFNTPAFVASQDFSGDACKLDEMRGLWDNFMTAFTRMAAVGNPWSHEYDAPRANYVDPTKPLTGNLKKAVQPITWTAFPNKVTWFFNTSQGNPYQVDKALIYTLADIGYLPNLLSNEGIDANAALDAMVLEQWIIAQGDSAASTKENYALLADKHPKILSLDPSDGVSFAPLDIPKGGSNLCPVVNWEAAKMHPFNSNVSGPRGWKDEYNEWVVRRDPNNGKITQVAFTAENPEYWFTLWQVDPVTVRDLYRQLTGTYTYNKDGTLKNVPNMNVTLSDLQMTDGDVLVHNVDGKPAYNPLNIWNYGNAALPNMGGAIHLTSPPNTVGAEIYLGGAASIMRDMGNDGYDPAAMICSGQYGGNFRNSDPNIGFQANQVVRNIGARYTLRNPIALYMQVPDFTNYITPDGRDAAELFHIIRGGIAEKPDGKYDQILHAIFQVRPCDTYETAPESCMDYTVSDIKIGLPANEGDIYPQFHKKKTLPIWYGSQMAETFNQALAAEAFVGAAPVETTRYPSVQPCKGACMPNGQPTQPLSMAQYKALNNQPKIAAATLPIIPLTVQKGRSYTDLGMQTFTAAGNADILFFDENGKETKGLFELSNRGALDEDNTPIQPNDSTVHDQMTFTFDLSVSENARDGLYGIFIKNPNGTAGISSEGAFTPEPGMILVRNPTH